MSFQKSTVIAGILGVLVGLSSFVLFNPDMASNLIADIAPNTSAIIGDVYYKVQKDTVLLYGNTSLEGIKQVSVMIAYAPGTELLSKGGNATAEPLGPSMSKYTISTAAIEKGKLVRSRAYKGKPEDIVISDVQFIDQDGQSVGASVTRSE
ncbi:MAG: hypothetical protein WC004_03675 [Candidatus Absconditabacterales bacterium]